MDRATTFDAMRVDVGVVETNLEGQYKKQSFRVAAYK